MEPYPRRRDHLCGWLWWAFFSIFIGRDFMKHSRNTVLALFAFLALSPAYASASTGTSQMCAKISEMLLDTQVRQHEFNPIEFELIDKTLKDTFLQACEQTAQNSSSEGRDGLEIESSMEDLNYSNGLALSRNGMWLLPNGDEFGLDSLLTLAARGGGAPILQPFLNAHRQCAPGCGYVSWGIWGDAKHQARRSCHNSGQAIDIHAITCGGTHAAPGARFSRYVGCMKSYLGIVYLNKDHMNHAHFQLRGCSKCQGRSCSGGNVSRNRAPARPRNRPSQNRNYREYNDYRQGNGGGEYIDEE